MYELDIENMSCGHCVSRVTQAIRLVDPAAEVNTDLSRKYMLISSECPLTELTDAILKAGYLAKPHAGA